jgi:hypothetical protein
LGRTSTKALSAGARDTAPITGSLGDIDVRDLARLMSFYLTEAGILAYCRRRRPDLGGRSISQANAVKDFGPVYDLLQLDFDYLNN